MIEFKKLNIASEYSIDFLVVEFEIEPTEEDMADYNFSIWRSNDIDSDFQRLCDNVTDFEYVDTSVNLKNNNVLYCYKVLATNIHTGETRESEVFHYRGGNEDPFFGHEFTYWAQWTYDWYLDTVINNDRYYLLRKKRTGSICSCVDNIRRTTRDNNCMRCYGVGFTGGYYNPVELKINFYSTRTSAESFQPSHITNKEEAIQAWTKSYPRLQVGDIILGSDPNGKRFRVMSVQTSKRKEYSMRQVFQMQEIPESDIAYRIPVDIDRMVIL